MAHLNEPVPIAGTTDVTAASQIAGIIFPSLARAVGVFTSAEIFNPGAKGVRLFVDVTVDNGGSVTVKLQTKDPFTDKFVDVVGATTAAIAGATQTLTLTVYPGVTAAAGSASTSSLASNFVDLSWRVIATVATATVTFSVGGVHLL